MHIHFFNSLYRWLVLFALLGMNQAYASCGSATCAVNTHWSNDGLYTDVGSQLDLRYEYIDQDQLMSDDSKVKPKGILDEHDEVSTVNRNIHAAYSYNSGEGWGISVSLPILSRSHDHVHNEAGGPEPEDWDFTKIGDVRVLGQFQLSTAVELATTYGVIGGVKLPTGRTDINNGAGERAERTLQPGTGTRDVMIGAYYSQMLASGHSSWFAQILAQSAINADEHFKPGGQVGIDLGYRYNMNERLGVQIQANYLMKWRDDGNQAEPAESGLRALFFSPGIHYAVTPSVQVYGFVQLPVYQNVNGTQLTADAALTAGVRTRF